MKRGIFTFIAVFVVKSVVAQVPLETWIKTYDGGNGEDIATAISVDTNGSVFVTGASMSTNGYPDFNLVTIKYSNSGLSLWTNFYGGAGNSLDRPVAMATDHFGNIFITGFSSGASSGTDFLTLGYSSAGAPLWTNLFNGSANSDDQAQSLAIDGNGNVSVVGYSWSGGLYDYVTIKYSNAGIPLWTNRYTGPDTSGNASSAVVFDADGNVIMTGSSLREDGRTDYATVKYSSAGTPAWTNRYNIPGNLANRPVAIAPDNNGNIFVTGISFRGGTNLDIATLAYSGAGIPLWTNRYNGASDNWDYAKAMAVADGKVFVTGYSEGLGGGTTTLAYSGAGVPLWTNIYAGVSETQPSAIAADNNGGVFVTGYSVGIGTGADYATIMYSSAGVPMATNLYNSPQNGSDLANAIAVGAGGTLFVTGFSDGNYATIKYSVVQPISLNVQKATDQLVMTWTNADFVLQSAPAIIGPFTNIVCATSPHTNTIIGAQQFFRLKAN